MEWAQLLEAQQRYHDTELQKWREIIKSSVVLLDQVLRHMTAFRPGYKWAALVTHVNARRTH